MEGSKEDDEKFSSIFFYSMEAIREKVGLSFQNWASANTLWIFQTWHKWLGVCFNLQSIPANSIFFKAIKVVFIPLSAEAVLHLAL